MKKCPRCGYYGVFYNADYDRYECHDCGWHN
jgi:ribosomal protein S27AE